ncbi:GNAT family N-acetyltransferase [Streptomyces calidiresistens]|uniref:GNAT family N-acetyltransferase n=1 Tax=Streptomyces calidiresistens TaxID=1485586 RepID=A0A7W3T6A2_9ACTN|nr:GNAT family N-acetyltransferase [Streptomyces calidiresistens]MBB0231719.1 GNAT family N-acetyltransferase [Streptomyces calidiresistens]
MTSPSAVVRPQRPEDLGALSEICLRTGHIGGDAREVYRDHDLLPDLFLRPYAALEPDLVRVAEDDGRVLGYIVGTADSTAFFRAFRERWLPTVADRHPAPTGPPGTPDEEMRDLLHHAERMLVPEIAARYPAHLHIDLLPEGQGRGLGRRLMEAYCGALRERGVPGVHLGMDPRNERARAFYERMGFTLLRSPAGAGVIHLGLALDREA